MAKDEVQPEGYMGEQIRGLCHKRAFVGLLGQLCGLCTAQGPHL